jgi:hypothetical protein
VAFYLTAVDPGIGFTFDSRSFGTASGRPALIVSAVPQPAIIGLSSSGRNVQLVATNGPVGGTYFVLSSTNLALPLNQWSRVATGSVVQKGAFSVTITNGAASDFAEFFLLQVQ